MSLQTQQHQDRPRTFRKRLECFADQRAGTMNLNTTEINRLRFHGETKNVTRDEQVADIDWRLGSIDSDSYPAGRRNENFVVALFRQAQCRAVQRSHPQPACRSFALMK